VVGGLLRVLGRGQFARWRCGRWVLRGFGVLSSPVQMEREAVDAECVGEQVEGLAVVSNAVCSSQPQRVVEVTVDAFGVVATRVKPVEVGVVGWDAIAADRSRALGARSRAAISDPPSRV
jgi:hypothetical protein